MSCTVQLGERPPDKEGLMFGASESNTELAS